MFAHIGKGAAACEHSKNQKNNMFKKWSFTFEVQADFKYCIRVYIYSYFAVKFVYFGNFLTKNL